MVSPHSHFNFFGYADSIETAGSYGSFFFFFCFETPAMLELICITINSEQTVPFLCIFASTFYLLSFDNGYAERSMI